MQLVYRLARYVLSGRIQAIRIGLLFSVLPFISWIANVVVALVTLRKGPKEGGLVLLWVLLPSVILAGTSNPWIWIYGILGYHFLGYVIATILHYSINWSAVLECLLITGLLVIMVLHWIFPNIQQFWLQYLQEVVALMTPTWAVQLSETQISTLSELATGLQIAALFISSLWNLLIARAIQSALYNPSGLSSELGSIRLSFSLSSVILIGIIASGIGDKIALDSLAVFILSGSLSGLSCLSSFLYATPRKRSWMILVGIGFMIFLPYILYGLSIISWLDSCFNLRKRWKPSE